MKCNTLSKGCSTYYKKLKTLIPVKGKYEKQFLSSIFESLEGICSEQPNISYDEPVSYTHLRPKDTSLYPRTK